VEGSREEQRNAMVQVAVIGRRGGRMRGAGTSSEAAREICVDHPQETKVLAQFSP
jgi:hypothetical protein